jgi:adenosylcobinamide-GDP ribazoletransferase
MTLHLLTAVRFLTIVPVPFGRAQSRDVVGQSQAYFPLVGLGLGLALVAVDQGLGRVLPDAPRAWLVVLTLTALSGGMHLDGLADSADGLLGASGRSPKERLAIMRDARVGAYGVIALIAVLFLKWSALLSLSHGLRAEALLLAPCLGRATIVVDAWAFPYARPAGLGLAVHQAAGRRPLAVAGAVALAVAGALLGLGGLVVAVTVIATALAAGAWAARRLGGVTGDVHGALVEVSEGVTLLLVAGGAERGWLQALLLG